MSGGGPISVALTATRNGNRISVTGVGGGPTLAPGRPATRFNFTLTDESNCNVRFVRLDTADECSDCPPPPGENSHQITGVVMHNALTPKTAHFTDNNSNPASAGPIDVAYQWHFACDCPGVSVDPYDPIISNGGRV